MSDDDMIRRGDAEAIPHSLAKSPAFFVSMREHAAYKRGVQDYQNAIAALPAVTVGVWMKGEPPSPWRDEWFIAKTIHGEKVVLRALPEEWTYDYTTADNTYMIAANIVCWMQFPDSEYIAPTADEAPRILAALEPQPAPALAPDVADLINDAADAAHEAYSDMGDVTHQAIDYMKEVALAALPAVTAGVTAQNVCDVVEAFFNAVADDDEWNVSDLQDDIQQHFAAPDTPAQCCMCGKRDLSTAEGDGGTECQLSDGRWTCSRECYDLALSLIEPQPADLMAVPEVKALVEAAQMARNRLEIIADKSWWGDGRDLKRSIVGVFADFDAALLACGSEVPADLRRDAEHANETPETEHDAGNVLTDAAPAAALAVPEVKALVEALQHMQWCRSCAEGSWEDCEGGLAALAALRGVTK